MILLLNIVSVIINFFQYNKRLYEDIKIKAFENKLIYYAIYNMQNKKYTLIHNYDNLLSVLFFYITNNLMKTNYAGITYKDLDFLLHDKNNIIVASYVINKKEYHKIFNYDTYINNQQCEKNKIDKIVYAYTDNVEDLTNEFEKFKDTIFCIKLSTQTLANILMYYKGKKLQKVEYIKYMIDNNFDEILLKE
jgi:hypothetical protein